MCTLSPGQVTIEFYVERETNFIVFHSKNLTITDRVSNFIINTLEILKLIFHFES